MQHNTTSTDDQIDQPRSSVKPDLERIVIRRLDRVETTLNCAAH
jgi:hypothetical protein